MKQSMGEGKTTYSWERRLYPWIAGYKSSIVNLSNMLCLL